MREKQNTRVHTWMKTIKTERDKGFLYRWRQHAATLPFLLSTRKVTRRNDSNSSQPRQTNIVMPVCIPMRATNCNILVPALSPLQFRFHAYTKEHETNISTYLFHRKWNTEYWYIQRSASSAEPFKLHMMTYDRCHRKIMFKVMRMMG